MSEAEPRGADWTGARDAGMDPDAVRRAFGLLETWIQDRVLPGAAALVARGGKVAGEAYLGMAQQANAVPVASDTIFSLASVTKPFTATAVMLLVERGIVTLDEPLGGLLPEFLEAPATPFDRRGVTLRHILAHCSGLPGFGPDNLALRQAHRPLEDFVHSFAQQPLFFEPGSAHMYSNVGILLAAEVVGRAVSGALSVAVETPRVGRYHGFVHEEILAPLGMTASSLLPPAAWNERIAWVEETGQQGQDYEMDNSAYYRSLGIPWGGMFSRPRDLARFVDLFLPTAAGRPRVGLDAATAATAPRLISPATAATMISQQFAPPQAPTNVAPGLREDDPGESPAPAIPWGIGWGLKGTVRAWPSGELSSAATYGHGGSSGTMVWADPQADVTCVLLTNRAFAGGWASDRPRLTLFSNAVLAAVR
jgi:CubicO group peptidase (beta-lactamase class C family)